ncbi:MAG: dihydroneopterin aldolase [Actinobacteria bacterium]|nr:dihydroneopterin aldolase [Actinomycetota bacterium]
MARDHIYINGLRLMALVGVLPHEREGLQPLQVDVDLEVDLSEAGITDNLDDTANYGAISQAIAEVVRDSTDTLLERLAARIADRVLHFDHVEVANVTLTKLRPPIHDDYAITSEELTVPHPRFSERRFVLEPLSEIASEHCPSHWRDRLPQYGVYPRGSIDSLVAHVTTS